MIEEDDPKPRLPRLVTPPLGTWDVDDLHDYIGELRAEITRAEAAIRAKQSHRAAADAVFRPT